MVVKQLFYRLRSSSTVMGRTRNVKVVAMLWLKTRGIEGYCGVLRGIERYCGLLRGIAGYSTACVGQRKAVESLGMV
jgi:hypothetical protein